MSLVMRKSNSFMKRNSAKITVEKKSLLNTVDQFAYVLNYNRSAIFKDTKHLVSKSSITEGILIEFGQN